MPITGAFGWTLGAKAPSGILNDVGMSPYIPVTNAPPFKDVQLIGLKDGTIYQITTWVNLTGFADVESALNEKYGPPADLHKQSEFKAWGVAALDDYKGRVLMWTNAGCTIELMLDGGGDGLSSLTYYSKLLDEKSFDEASEENARRAKNLAPKL